ncbi:unnamed protein product [Lampetra planeri]
MTAMGGAVRKASLLACGGGQRYASVDEEDITSDLMLDMSGRKIRRAPPQLCALGHIVKLYLSNNRLRELPEEFGFLSSLRILALDFNKFEEFPPVLCRLTELCRLYLGSNLLQDLPDEMRSLVNLKALWLEGNYLRHLPPVLWELPQLRSLQVGDNRLKALPRELRRLASLRGLWLYGNRFEEFPDVLLRMELLEIIDVDRNRISEFPSLERLTRLKVISYDHNPCKGPPCVAPGVLLVGDGAEEANSLNAAAAAAEDGGDGDDDGGGGNSDECGVVHHGILKNGTHSAGHASDEGMEMQCAKEEEAERVNTDNLNPPSVLKTEPGPHELEVPKARDEDRFEALSQETVSALALTRGCVAELMDFKDVLLQHSLPGALRARKQRLLDVAMRRLQLVHEQVRRVAEERKLIRWEKMFMKMTRTSVFSHGTLTGQATDVLGAKWPNMVASFMEEATQRGDVRSVQKTSSEGFSKGNSDEDVDVDDDDYDDEDDSDDQDMFIPTERHWRKRPAPMSMAPRRREFGTQTDATAQTDTDAQADTSTRTNADTQTDVHAQTDTHTQTQTGAQGDAGTQTKTAAQSDGISQTDRISHVDTGAQTDTDVVDEEYVPRPDPLGQADGTLLLENVTCTDAASQTEAPAEGRWCGGEQAVRGRRSGRLLMDRRSEEAARIEGILAAHGRLAPVPRDPWDLCRGAAFFPSPVRPPRPRPRPQPPPSPFHLPPLHATPQKLVFMEFLGKRGPQTHSAPWASDAATSTETTHVESPPLKGSGEGRPTSN